MALSLSQLFLCLPQHIAQAMLPETSQGRGMIGVPIEIRGMGLRRSEDPAHPLPDFYGKDALCIPAAIFFENSFT